jgi:hypothetical protein
MLLKEQLIIQCKVSKISQNNQNGGVLGQKRSKMVKNGQKWSKTVKIDQNEPKWTILRIFTIFDDFSHISREKKTRFLIYFGVKF